MLPSHMSINANKRTQETKFCTAVIVLFFHDARLSTHLNLYSGGRTGVAPALQEYTQISCEAVAYQVTVVKG